MTPTPTPTPTPKALQPLSLADADVVVALFREGAAACRSAPCRRGSIDLVRAPGRLIATGDLHDHPLNFKKLVEAAGLGKPDPAHLILHEIIHPPNLLNGVDYSYRALARAAALKSEFPEHVHILLGNHELSQIMGAGIVKDGVRVVEAFNAGLDNVFAERGPEVLEAIREFVLAMPLALRCECNRPDGSRGVDILCAHSLPGLAMMQRFDPSVLSRDLTPQDYEPRTGAAHIMVWGRGYDAEQLEDLVERWGINLFILGHEKAPSGATLVPPNAVVLNTDHENGVYLPIDLSDPPSASQAMQRLVRLNDDAVFSS
ncbi:MAG: metallophosphoesterase [Phycisphaerales bacterium]|nr:metallophosphoesterase [Planctomycetota bacterium]